jgi:hypothetical protein
LILLLTCCFSRENLKVQLFRCQWIRLPNEVKTDKYGMTNVNFIFLSYREQSFVLAKDVTQVFYVKDPDLANKEEHHIVLQGKKKNCWCWRCCWWGRVQPVWRCASIWWRYHYPYHWWHRWTYVHTSWSRWSNHCSMKQFELLLNN